MHEERYELGEETARVVNEAKQDGRRVIAVGTTTVRVLESVAAQNGGRLAAGGGPHAHIHLSAIFTFQMVDALLDQFSSAALDAADAGVRLCRAAVETGGREMVLVRLR